MFTRFKVHTVYIDDMRGKAILIVAVGGEACRIISLTIKAR